VISQGDTFYSTGFDNNVDSHLLVLISKPELDPNHLVFVSLTTWETYKDDSCLLFPCDHSFVKHDTCVRYDGVPYTPSITQVEKLLSNGKLRKREPINSEVLRRILEGAAETRFIPNRLATILTEQELID
jgi:hypothetical protein